MTAPAVLSTRRTKSTSDATSRSVPLPPTIVAGDTLIAICTNDGSSSVGWDNTTAGVWEEIHSTVEATIGSHRLSAYRRIATGFESGLTLTVTTSAAEHFMCHVYRIGEPVEIEFAVNANQGDVNPDPPSLSPSWGAAETLWLIAAAHDRANVRNFGFPLGDVVVDPSPAAPWSATDIYDGGDSNSTVGLLTAWTASSVATLDPPAIGTERKGRAMAATYALRRAAQIVELPAPIASTVEFFSLSVKPAVALPFFQAEPTFYPLTMIYDQIVEFDLFENTNTFFPLGVVTAEIGIPFLASTVEFFPITVEPGEAPVELPHIGSTVQFFPLLVTGGARVVPEFDSVALGPFPGAFGDVAIYSGSSQGAAFASRWARRGPIGFSDFAPFIAGEYEFEAAVIWLSLNVEEVERTFAITRAKLNVDVPDIIARGEADIPEGGAFVEFDRSFYQPPEVVANVVAAEGVDTVPRTTIRDDVSTTGFFVTAHLGDDVTNSVAARVKYIATGY